MSTPGQPTAAIQGDSVSRGRGEQGDIQCGVDNNEELNAGPSEELMVLHDIILINSCVPVVEYSRFDRRLFFSVVVSSQLWFAVKATHSRLWGH
jgi:hypothetical protein